MNKYNFPYHLVSISPWPLMMSLSVMLMLSGGLMFFTDLKLNLLMISNLFVFLVMYQWWRDVIRESLYQGAHNIFVLSGLRLGMLLFILSELMFFVSFFWTYFQLFLSPSVELGGGCPSFNLEVFNSYNIPLLNTMILLTSGGFITWGHHSMMNSDYKMAKKSILVTIMLGVLFSFFQYLEYSESYFSISDSMYGSIFFLVTGFHGLHVLIGTLFIFISWVRLNKKEFSYFHHFGFEASCWYWHFVDVVWLFLYIFVYWLSN